MSKFITSLEDLAFEEILRTIYETLSIEGGGSLFGEIRELKSQTKYIVESAHPIQLAIRYPNSMNPQSGSIRADWSLFNEQIGSYHLHPHGRKQKNHIRKTIPGKIYLSKIDRKNLKEDRDKIEIITSLNEVKRKTKLSINPFLISGYIEDDGQKYRFDMGSYINNGRIRRCLIEVSPKATRLVR